MVVWSAPLWSMTIAVSRSGFGWRVEATACARRGLTPSSVLRDLLEREFPDTSRQFRLPL
jgi:hypothetical protein